MQPVCARPRNDGVATSLKGGDSRVQQMKDSRLNMQHFTSADRCECVELSFFFFLTGEQHDCVFTQATTKDPQIKLSRLNGIFLRVL